MKTFSKSLTDFIQHFELAKPDCSICFEAVIYFSTERTNIELETAIHIVRIENKNLDAIYLLNPEVIIHGIPDFYARNIHRFKYVTGKAFVIYGKIGKSDFTLSIHPGKKECDDFTFEEIHAKTYN